MLNKKDQSERLIKYVVSTISNLTEELMLFGYELRKADKEFKYSNEILDYGLIQMSLYNVILK